MDLYVSILLSVCLIFSFIYFLILCKFSLENEQFFPSFFYALLSVLTGVAIGISTNNYLGEMLPLWGFLIVAGILLLLFKQSFDTLKVYIRNIENKVISAKKEVYASQVEIQELEKRLSVIINDLKKED